MDSGISTSPNPRPNPGGYLSARPLLHGLHGYGMGLCMGYYRAILLIKHGGLPVCMGCMGRNQLLSEKKKIYPFGNKGGEQKNSGSQPMQPMQTGKKTLLINKMYSCQPMQRPMQHPCNPCNPCRHNLDRD